MVFYLTASQEGCSYKPVELMWDLTLSQFLDEREFLEARDALRTATMKDLEPKSK